MKRRNDPMTSTSSSIDPLSRANSDAEEIDAVGQIASEENPSFHALTQDYLINEAHYHFASEVVVFCLLFIATAASLLNGADAVIQLIRSTSLPGW